jgi:hypothetical protein
MTCPCSQPNPVRGAFPKAARSLSINRAALRRELGGVAEIREAMTAKASGRPSANVSVLWGYYAEPMITRGRSSTSRF